MNNDTSFIEFFKVMLSLSKTYKQDSWRLIPGIIDQCMADLCTEPQPTRVAPLQAQQIIHAWPGAERAVKRLARAKNNETDTKRARTLLCWAPSIDRDRKATRTHKHEPLSLDFSGLPDLNP